MNSIFKGCSAHDKHKTSSCNSIPLNPKAHGPSKWLPFNIHVTTIVNLMVSEHQMTLCTGVIFAQNMLRYTIIKFYKVWLKQMQDRVFVWPSKPDRLLSLRGTILVKYKKEFHPQQLCSMPVVIPTMPPQPTKTIKS